MWYKDKKVLMTFCSNHSKNCWASIESLGWRKIKTGSTDGVTNMYMIICSAKASNRQVDVNVDSDNQIDMAYLK